jgi:hypothetical protein
MLYASKETPSMKEEYAGASSAERLAKGRSTNKARGFGKCMRVSRVREASGLALDECEGVDPGNGIFLPRYEDAGLKIVGCG